MHKEIGDTSIAITKAANMTYIEWGGYSRSHGNNGGSILTAYTDGAPTIDTVWVEERNPGYFRARNERNAERQNALTANPSAFEEAAQAINAIRQAQATLERLTAYGEGPLVADRYRILDLLK